MHSTQAEKVVISHIAAGDRSWGFEIEPPLEMSAESFETLTGNNAEEVVESTGTLRVSSEADDAMLVQMARQLITASGREGAHIALVELPQA